jgi:diacylglycerol O-acyltransferase
MSAARKQQAGRGGDRTVFGAADSILNGPLTARRRLGTQSLPIARMKALGAAIEGGATVNEILLAVCGGALRRYLVEQNALPEQPLIAACPVAMPRKEEGAAGSAVGQILVSLGTHVADPKQRLLAVVASSKVNKELMKAIEGEAYAHYTELSMMPQVLAAKGGFGHKVLNANLVISNVPGPREAQYTNGALLESMYAASMLLAGQALNITVSNFGDNLDMGIMACPDLCPSPQKIAVYAGEELTLLELAMGLKPPARKAASKTATRKRAAAKKPAPAKAAQDTASTKKPAVKKVAAKKMPLKKAVVVAGVEAKAVVAKKVSVKKAAVKKSKAGR